MSDIVKQSDRIGIPLAILTAAIFGIYPAASRAAYADGANLTFVLYMATFFRTAGLVVYCLLTGRALFPSVKTSRPAIVAGFWQGLSVIGIIAALAFLPGPLVIIIVFLNPMMIYLYSVFCGEMKLDAASVLVILTTLAGLSFVLDLWHVQNALSWIGYLLAFMGATATAVRIYIYGGQMSFRHPAVVGAESFLVACGTVFLLLFWKLPVLPGSLDGWLWSLAGAASLSVGTFGMFFGVALMGAFRWTLFSKIEPIFTTLFSILLIHEPLKMSQYAGMALVISSLMAYQIFNRREAPVQAASVD